MVSRAVNVEKFSPLDRAGLVPSLKASQHVSSRLPATAESPRRRPGLLGTPLPDRTLALLRRSCQSTPAERLRRKAKPMLKCMRLLTSCGYEREEVEVVVAHATAYFDRILKQLQDAHQEVDLAEMLYIFCVLLYIAHSYVEDATCPLKFWHARAFVQYCELCTLNAAVVETMRKLDFRLRVESEELQARLAFLRAEEEHSAVALAALEMHKHLGTRSCAAAA